MMAAIHDRGTVPDWTWDGHKLVHETICADAMPQKRNWLSAIASFDRTLARWIIPIMAER